MLHTQHTLISPKWFGCRNAIEFGNVNHHHHPHHQYSVLGSVRLSSTQLRLERISSNIWHQNRETVEKLLTNDAIHAHINTHKHIHTNSMCVCVLSYVRGSHLIHCFNFTLNISTTSSEKRRA